jgi:putative sterol carrier protein
MEFYSGGKRHAINLDAVKVMSYEQLKEVFEGKLDYKTLAKKLGIKPTPKKRVKKSED